MTTFRKLALALAVAATAAVATAASGSAQDRAPQTLLFLSVQQSFMMVPQASRTAPPQVGGRLIFTDAMYNRVAQFGKPAGARVGTAEGVCTLVGIGKAQCVVTAHVPDGQIVAIGAMALRRGLGTSRFAIAGGAGAYGSARGTVTSRDVSQSRTLVDLDLSA